MKIPFKINLEGKTAVVTGASGTLCSLMAKALAECGASVALIGRTRSKLEAVAEEISADGGIAAAFPADVMDRTALEKAKEEINGRFGPVDILINGAGGADIAANTDNEYYEEGDLMRDMQNFFNLPKENYQKVFNVNYMGTVLPTQVFAQDMVLKKSGSIINISSINYIRPLTKIPAYSSAKAAIASLTSWLAVYLSKVGVRVNCIAPGVFLSAQNEWMLYNNDGTPTHRTEKILRTTPLGRFGNPEELLGGLLYLLSDEGASFVTGQVLAIDGGFTTYSGV